MVCRSIVESHRQHLRFVNTYIAVKKEERQEGIIIIVAMGGGANPSTHNYPTQVWTPTGGWWCHPKLWRRNTVFAFAGIIAVCIPIAMKSAELEVLKALDGVSHSPRLTFDVIPQRNEWMNGVLVFLAFLLWDFLLLVHVSWMNQRIVYVCVFLPCDLADWVKAILRSYTLLGPKPEFRNSG